MDIRNLPPSAVVLDLVLRYSPVIGAVGTATVTGDSLTFAARNHLGEFVMLSAQVHFDGDPQDGAQPRFVLRQLGATVWKLAPSILSDRLHAYLTIIDVPEPAPWIDRG